MQSECSGLVTIGLLYMHAHCAGAYHLTACLEACLPHGAHSAGWPGCEWLDASFAWSANFHSAMGLPYQLT